MLFKFVRNKIITLKKNYMLSIVKRIFHNSTSLLLKKTDVLKSLRQEKEDKTENFNVNYDDLLCKNLKHLEFIAFLEMNYTAKKQDVFSSDLIKSIHQTKIEAQINILNLINSKVA